LEVDMRVALAVAAALALAVPARGDMVQSATKVYPVTPQHRVRVDFPVGSLHIEANDDSQVRLNLVVRCSTRDADDCAEVANKLKLTVTNEDNVLTLKLDKLPTFAHNVNIEGVLQVPRALPVHVEMGVGDVRVYDMEGEVDIELGVGDAQARLPDNSVHAVDIEVGVGDATLKRQGRTMASRGFIGREVHWDDGAGRSRVRFHVGVGDGEVRLE
jgi:hypothetical protein